MLKSRNPEKLKPQRYTENTEKTNNGKSRKL